MTDNAYHRAGVDILAGQRATALMKEAVQATYGPEVLSQTGAFGGLFAANALKEMNAPVLVASTDGVGTKTMVAAHVGRWDTIGQDLVNHCVNDILVQGAQPLFFLDYVASSRLEPDQIADVVRGCALACRAVGCALLGGETAEMPGVYQPGELDLAGTIVGVVDKAAIIDGKRIQPGDVIFALPSTGLHTNGYSLARKVLSDVSWIEPHADLNGETIADVLLAVHRCYLSEINQLRDSGIDIRGLAHITGGGVVDNLPRILPDHVDAHINRGTWNEPPVFELIQKKDDISDKDMFHAFNMGLGMLVVVPAEQRSQIRSLLDDIREVGMIVANGEGKCVVK